MPVKLRIAKQRRPLFSLEVLELFIHLEGIRDEDSREFQDGSKRLAQLLNLGAEYLCSCTSVTHRELHHSMPNDDYPSAQDWLRVRAVRLQLLAAVAEAQRNGVAIRTDRVAPSHDALVIHRSSPLPLIEVSRTRYVDK